MKAGTSMNFLTKKVMLVTSDLSAKISEFLTSYCVSL